MNIFKTLVLGVFGLLIGVSLLPGVASAQVVASPIAAQCINFGVNLRFGTNDSATSGGVTALQNFLVGQGFFSSIYIGSGNFGPITMRAVMQFQSAHGVPATGYVGPLTRAAISQIGCGTTPPITTPVSLYWLSPTSGAVGNTISITGFGFTSSNTIYMDGSVAAQNVPITSSIAVACTTDPSCRGGIRQTITFTIPSSLSPYCAPGMMCAMYMRQVTPGSYNVTVQNTNGTSNGLALAVTSGTTQTLSISGLDAPTTLALGQSGTWTVHVLAGSGSGTLHYSVVWDDEAGMTTSNIVAPAPSTTQTLATFTHAYSRSGNYVPIFTVTDDSGHVVNTSTTIVVTPLY